MDTITIYHGSTNIVTPVFGEGKTYNDYGQGFYCTENLEMAKEWACSQDSDGYANQYILNLEGLTILHLNEPQYNILNWLAILLENRRFSVAEGLPYEAKHYILDNFLPEYKSYDIIKGYRADDSYFSFARAFVSNEISLGQLSRAMKLGKLGEQFVLKSREAFEAIQFVSYVASDNTIYYARRKARDDAARAAFFAELERDDMDGM